jgi:hypothetical protein
MSAGSILSLRSAPRRCLFAFVSSACNRPVPAEHGGESRPARSRHRGRGHARAISPSNRGTGVTVVVQSACAHAHARACSSGSPLRPRCLAPVWTPISGATTTIDACCASWRVGGASWRVGGASWRVGGASWRVGGASWRAGGASWRVEARAGGWEARAGDAAQLTTCTVHLRHPPYPGNREVRKFPGGSRGTVTARSSGWWVRLLNSAGRHRRAEGQCSPDQPDQRRRASGSRTVHSARVRHKGAFRIRLQQLC